ncbi:GFA family protein [uncultured Sphingomonas sp.]|uniref:GFA family protein n=1 Tax=uncultured Sphingomonas sp. TaxID=158754 RepID=UPI0035C9D321
MATRVGGCRCGSVRYQVEGDPVVGIACHCRDCQYVAGGAANLTWVFNRLGFAVTAGKPHIYKATSKSGGSFFCAGCGVHMFSQPDTNPGLVAVKVGSLDDATGFKVDADIWMKFAPAWHSAQEGSLHFDGNPEI